MKENLQFATRPVDAAGADSTPLTACLCNSNLSSSLAMHWIHKGVCSYPKFCSVGCTVEHVTIPEWQQAMISCVHAGLLI